MNISLPHFLQQPIHDRLSEAVSRSDTESIILFVKILGNAGHPSSLKSLTKIMPIHGTAAASLPMRIHVEAIMALRNIAKKEPRMVSYECHRVLERKLLLLFSV